MDDEMIWLVATGIFILVGGGLFLFVSLGGFEGISVYIEQWCQDNPSVCGTTDEDSFNYKLAENSAEALSCAINSVTLGEEKQEGNCFEYFKKGSPLVGGGGGSDGGGSSGGIQIIDSNTREEFDDVINDPAWGSASSSGIHGPQPELSGGLSFTGNLGAGYRGFITGMATNDDIGLEVPRIDCAGSGDSFKCTVLDYTTPQNYNYMLASATEYIGGFGDPNFLVYYVKFPEGENDEWSSITPWWRTLSGMVLLGACAGRVGGTVFQGIKVAGTALKGTTKFIRPAGDMITDATKRGQRISKYFKKMGGDAGEALDKKVSSLLNRMKDKTSFIGSSALKSGKIKKTTELVISDDIIKGARKRVDAEQFMNEMKIIDEAKRTNVRAAFNTLGDARSPITGGVTEITDEVLKGAKTITENIDSATLRGVLEKTWGLGKEDAGNIIKAGEFVLKNPSFKSKFIGQSGAGIGAWFASKLDSEVGKFIEEYPNSLVLRTALRPDLIRTFTLNLPDVEPGSKKNSLDVEYDIPLMLKRPEISGGGNTVLYSASPCKADLNVYIDDDLECDSFRYEKGNSERASLSLCEQDESGWFDSSFDHKCNEVPIMIREDSTRINEVAANLSNNMNSLPVYIRGTGDDENYDKIYYPLLRAGEAEEGGLFYFKFNRDTGKVTHISANIGDVTKPGENGEFDGSDMLPAQEYDISQLRTDKSRGFKLGRWKGKPCAVFSIGLPILGYSDRHFRVYNDDGCSLVTIGEDDQDFDMDILKGDRVIRCTFDGNIEDEDERGIIFQDYGLGEGEVRTSMTFYYTIDANNKADEFIGIRIDQTSDENKMIINKLRTVLSLVLLDSKGPDGKRDGKIDSLSYSGRADYYNLHIINELGKDYSTIVVKDIDADGKPDNILNTGCNTPAMMVKFDLGGGDNNDQEGNNYCIRKKARDTVENVVVVAGVATSLVTAFMKATIAASVIGLAVDCGLGLTEAVLTRHNWPSGEGGTFRPSG